MTIKKGDCVVCLNETPIDVGLIYKDRGFATLPPTPTICVRDLRIFAGDADHNKSYQIVGPDREWPQRFYVANEEAIAVQDGDRFTSIPPATW